MMLTQVAKGQSALATMILGSLFLIAGSLLKIPFYPVSFTGHTLVLFLLALKYPPPIAAGSAVCYLLWASLGLPVFGGQANPLWILGKSAGFLLSFPLAAYAISHLKARLGPLPAIFCGQLAIYTIGFLWLVPFIGPKLALSHGVLIFLPSALLKALIASKLCPQ
jgi:biotin transport system substrate-specific component